MVNISPPLTYEYYSYHPVLELLQYKLVPQLRTSCTFWKSQKLSFFHQHDADLPGPSHIHPGNNKVKHETVLPPPFTKWCVRTVSVWIIGSLAVAVTSSSPRSCLRKSSITSPARVNRMQIKTTQNWNTTMGVGNRSMADVKRWHETPVQLHVSACMYQYDTGLIMNRKWDMVLSGCRICRLWCDVPSRDNWD